jgi:hypothetical protein
MTDILDTSDPKVVKAAIKDAKSRETIEREGLRQTMSTEAGRKWLHSLILRCRPFTSPFSSDALIMANNCGEANVGLQIIADMHEVSPELYLQMMKENK